MIVPSVWSVFFYGWIVFEVFIATYKRTDEAAGSVQDRGTQALLWVVIFTSITACEFMRHILAPNMVHAFATAGFIVLLAGIAVRCIAIITLGKAFSANVAIKSTQTIQRTGIYSVLRHPSYSGLLLIFLAIGLHSRNWLALAVAFLPSTAVLLYRIRIEEAVLSSTFGPEYAAYCRVTKRLVPGVY
jgi:protein-S-isoprenylcysteine O-methyltransferase Ste14